MQTFIFAKSSLYIRGEMHWNKKMYLPCCRISYRTTKGVFLRPKAALEGEEGREEMALLLLFLPPLPKDDRCPTRERNKKREKMAPPPPLLCQTVVCVPPSFFRQKSSWSACPIFFPKCGNANIWVWRILCRFLHADFGSHGVGNGIIGTIWKIVRINQFLWHIWQIARI